MRSPVEAIDLREPWRESAAPEPKIVRAEILEDEAALVALGPEWEALYLACERPSPCALHAWVVAWWGAFGREAEGAGRETALFVVALRDEAGRLVGAIPLFEERASGLSLRVRRLRSVGFLGREGVYDMTEEPAVLLRPGWEAAALRAFADALRPHLLRGRWDLVFFRLLEGGSPAPLDDAFRRLPPGLWVKTDRKTGPYAARLPGDWAAYRRSLSKSMRDNLGYYPRLLDRDGHAWSVRTLRDPAAMAGAAARLAALHHGRAAQARGRRHQDHIHGTVQERFLAELLRGLAAQGRAFVAELVVDGEVVGSQAFVEDRDQLMVYYSGYAEAWYRYSPIFVIEAAVFREALERGVRSLDFLRTRSAWKARWGATECAPMHRVFVVPRRPLSGLRLFLYLAGLLWRRDVVRRGPKLLRKLRRALFPKRSPRETPPLSAERGR